MPRVARKKSNTQIYHVMLRGIDKRDIFLEKSHYTKFLYFILKSKEKSLFTVYGYCLMTNHVHILIKAESDEIGNIIRRITVRYAQFHNFKYGRSGHLFENRFKSEPVEDNRYFLTVLRYIHQNPVKAGIVSHLASYQWSSYHEYTGKLKTKIVDIALALNFFADIKSFSDFMIKKDDSCCIRDSTKKIYNDSDLLKIISEITDIKYLNMLEIHIRNNEIKKIKEKTGASNRQLSRVLNIGRGILERVK